MTGRASSSMSELPVGETEGGGGERGGRRWAGDGVGLGSSWRGLGTRGIGGLTVGVDWARQWRLEGRQGREGKRDEGNAEREGRVRGCRHSIPDRREGHPSYSLLGTVRWLLGGDDGPALRYVDSEYGDRPLQQGASECRVQTLDICRCSTMGEVTRTCNFRIH